MIHYPYGTPAEALPPEGALAPDVTRATTFAMRDAETLRDVGAGDLPGEFYPRYGHPLGRQFEGEVARLEGAEGAVAYASGMGAFHGVFCGLLDRGDVLVCSPQVYGGVHALLAHDLPRFGIEVVYVDPFDPELLRKTLSSLTDRDRPGSDLAIQGPAAPGTGPRHGGPPRDDATRVLVHIETPVNPTLRILDVAAIARIVHEAGGWLSVDATFLPPPFQRPFLEGADLVIHSATKFLGGHSDALGGIVSSRHELLGPLERFRRRSGGVLAPDTAWLYLRSLRTLRVRVQAQAETAGRLAEWLDQAELPGNERVHVHYPGLAHHPDHEIAARRLDGFGPMLLFELEDLERAVGVYNRFGTIARAVSLGGVESVASLPIHTSHSSNSPEQLESAGITPGMIRISVGLEPFEDLQADIKKAFAVR